MVGSANIWPWPLDDDLGICYALAQYRDVCQWSNVSHQECIQRTISIVYCSTVVYAFNSSQVCNRVFDGQIVGSMKVTYYVIRKKNAMCSIDRVCGGHWTANVCVIKWRNSAFGGRLFNSQWKLLNGRHVPFLMVKLSVSVER
jgi:hypothetical protein